jgi:hypothetical protein
MEVPGAAKSPTGSDYWMVYNYTDNYSSTNLRIVNPSFDPKTYVTKSVMGASDGLI